MRLKRQREEEKPWEVSCALLGRWEFLGEGRAQLGPRGCRRLSPSEGAGGRCREVQRTCCPIIGLFTEARILEFYVKSTTFKMLESNFLKF